MNHVRLLGLRSRLGTPNWKSSLLIRPRVDLKHNVNSRQGVIESTITVTPQKEKSNSRRVNELSTIQNNNNASGHQCSSDCKGVNHVGNIGDNTKAEKVPFQEIIHFRTVFECDGDCGNPFIAIAKKYATNLLNGKIDFNVIYNRGKRYNPSIFWKELLNGLITNATKNDDTRMFRYILCLINEMISTLDGPKINILDINHIKDSKLRCKLAEMMNEVGIEKETRSQLDRIHKILSKMFENTRIIDDYKVFKQQDESFNDFILNRLLGDILIHSTNDTNGINGINGVNGDHKILNEKFQKIDRNLFYQLYNGSGKVNIKKCDISLEKLLINTLDYFAEKVDPLGCSIQCLYNNNDNFENEIKRSEIYDSYLKERTSCDEIYESADNQARGLNLNEITAIRLWTIESVCNKVKSYHFNGKSCQFRHLCSMIFSGLKKLCDYDEKHNIKYDIMYSGIHNTQFDCKKNKYGYYEHNPTRIESFLSRNKNNINDDYNYEYHDYLVVDTFTSCSVDIGVAWEFTHEDGMILKFDKCNGFGASIRYISRYGGEDEILCLPFMMKMDASAINVNNMNHKNIRCYDTSIVSGESSFGMMFKHIKDGILSCYNSNAKTSSNANSFETALGYIDEQESMVGNVVDVCDIYPDIDDIIKDIGLITHLPKNENNESNCDISTTTVNDNNTTTNDNDNVAGSGMSSNKNSMLNENSNNCKLKISRQLNGIQIKAPKFFHLFAAFDKNTYDTYDKAFATLLKYQKYHLYFKTDALSCQYLIFAVVFDNRINKFDNISQCIAYFGNTEFILSPTIPHRHGCDCQWRNEFIEKVWLLLQNECLFSKRRKNQAASLALNINKLSNNAESPISQFVKENGYDSSDHSIWNGNYREYFNDKYKKNSDIWRCICDGNGNGIIPIISKPRRYDINGHGNTDVHLEYFDKIFKLCYEYTQEVDIIRGSILSQVGKYINNVDIDMNNVECYEYVPALMNCGAMISEEERKLWLPDCDMNSNQLHNKMQQVYDTISEHDEFGIYSCVKNHVLNHIKRQQHHNCSNNETENINVYCLKFPRNELYNNFRNSNEMKQDIKIDSETESIQTNSILKKSMLYMVNSIGSRLKSFTLLFSYWLCNDNEECIICFTINIKLDLQMLETYYDKYIVYNRIPLITGGYDNKLFLDLIISSLTNGTITIPPINNHNSSYRNQHGNQHGNQNRNKNKRKRTKKNDDATHVMAMIELLAGYIDINSLNNDQIGEIRNDIKKSKKCLSKIFDLIDIGSECKTRRKLVENRHDVNAYKTVTPNFSIVNLTFYNEYSGNNEIGSINNNWISFLKQCNENTISTYLLKYFLFLDILLAHETKLTKLGSRWYYDNFQSKLFFNQIRYCRHICLSSQFQDICKILYVCGVFDNHELPLCPKKHSKNNFKYDAYCGDGCIRWRVFQTDCNLMKMIDINNKKNQNDSIFTQIHNEISKYNNNNNNTNKVIIISEIFEIKNGCILHSDSKIEREISQDEMTNTMSTYSTSSSIDGTDFNSLTPTFTATTLSGINSVTFTQSESNGIDENIDIGLPTNTVSKPIAKNSNNENNAANADSPANSTNPTNSTNQALVRERKSIVREANVA